MIIDLLTSHCGLKRHNVGLAEDIIRGFWKEERYIPVYVFCYCEGRMMITLLVLSIENPSTHSYIEHALKGGKRWKRSVEPPQQNSNMVM